jgi:hypothetical protein
MARTWVTCRCDVVHSLRVPRLAGSRPLRLVPSLRDLRFTASLPSAYALGYPMPPLRGFFLVIVPLMRARTVPSFCPTAGIALELRRHAVA